MAVIQEHSSGGSRFVIRPNCALSWRATKLLVFGFACCFGLLGAYCASIGAWLVLPFAGLELVVLAAGFYLAAIAGHRRELIEIDGPVLRVLRGGSRLEEVARFPTHWTRVRLRHDPRHWYPGRLLLSCHDRRLEVAAKVIEAEREELALALESCLGVACLDHPQSPAGSRGSAAPRGARQRAGCSGSCAELGAPGAADSVIPSPTPAARSADHKF